MAQGQSTAPPAAGHPRLPQRAGSLLQHEHPPASTSRKAARVVVPAASARAMQTTAAPDGAVTTPDAPPRPRPVCWVAQASSTGSRTSAGRCRWCSSPWAPSPPAPSAPSSPAPRCAVPPRGAAAKRARRLGGGRGGGVGGDLDGNMVGNTGGDSDSDGDSGSDARTKTRTATRMLTRTVARRRVRVAACHLAREDGAGAPTPPPLSTQRLAAIAATAATAATAANAWMFR